MGLYSVDRYRLGIITCLITNIWYKQAYIRAIAALSINRIIPAVLLWNHTPKIADYNLYLAQCLAMIRLL